MFVLFTPVVHQRLNARNIRERSPMGSLGAPVSAPARSLSGPLNAKDLSQCDNCYLLVELVALRQVVPRRAARTSDAMRPHRRDSRERPLNAGELSQRDNFHLPNPARINRTWFHRNFQIASCLPPYLSDPRH
jgi:hypothetical protein